MDTVPEPTDHALGFLAGSGETGALIRAHDWDASPLGPPGAWPQSLKVAIRIVLSSRHPMFIWWGPELIQFYNDAYRRYIGSEIHPSAIGARGRETWGDIWPIIGPQIDQVMSGGGATWNEDHLVPIRRHGRVEDVWWTYGYSPIDDETAPGGIGGVLVICHETTAKVVAQERQAFLLELGDALRPLCEPGGIITCAGEHLGRKLQAGQIAYATVDAVGGGTDVAHDWNDGSIASSVGHHRLADLGTAVCDELRAGTTVAIDDVATDARTADARTTAMFRQRNIRAFIAVPVIEEGRLRATFGVHSREPRSWSDHHATLAKETAQRVGPALARAATEAALRESEQRFRQFGEASSDVLWIRDPESRRWEYLTAAFEKIYGMTRKKAMDGENALFELMLPEDWKRTRRDRARARSGQYVSLEYRIRRPSDGAVRWIRSTNFPLRVVAGRATRIGGIGRDVTEEKEMADRLQLLVAELQHRTRNLLGVVNAMANRTFATTPDPQGFRDRFRARLEALGRANDLLSYHAVGETITFDGLLRAELGALGALDANGQADRVTLDGIADIPLRAAVIQILALAVHELATNAIRYGALATDGGRLRVKWTLARQKTEARSMLRVVWHESGVGIPAGVRTRPAIGYGRQLIEKALPYQFDAETTYQLKANGLRCTIDLPMPVDA